MLPGLEVRGCGLAEGMSAKGIGRLETTTTCQVLLNILRHAVGQLLVEGSQGFHLPAYSVKMSMQACLT